MKNELIGKSVKIKDITRNSYIRDLMFIAMIAPKEAHAWLDSFITKEPILGTITNYSEATSNYEIDHKFAINWFNINDFELLESNNDKK